MVEKSAAIVTTWGDQGPGLTPDTQVATIVAAADERVAPLVNRLVGVAQVVDVPWPTYGYDQARTRYAPAFQHRPPYEQVWRFNTRKLIEFPPVIAYMAP